MSVALVGVARLGCVALALATLAWAATVLPLTDDRMLGRVADAIASGDRFDESATPWLLAEIDRPAGRLCRERRERDALVIRARLFEEALSGGRLDALDTRLGEMESGARRLLGCSPADSFGWLALAWARAHASGFGPEAESFLARSYETGPHEVWIAVRRNRIAAGLYEALPPDLQRRVVAEFAEIVRFGGHAQALATLSAVGDRLRATLLAGLADLPDETRRNLARQAYRQGVEIEIPGVAPVDAPRFGRG